MNDNPEFGLRFADIHGHHTVLLKVEYFGTDNIRIKVRRMDAEWWCAPPTGVRWQVYPAIGDVWSKPTEEAAQYIADRLYRVSFKD